MLCDSGNVKTISKWSLIISSFFPSITIQSSFTMKWNWSPFGRIITILPNRKTIWVTLIALVMLTGFKLIWKQNNLQNQTYKLSIMSMSWKFNSTTYCNVLKFHKCTIIIAVSESKSKIVLYGKNNSYNGPFTYKSNVFDIFFATSQNWSILLVLSFLTS